MTPKKWFALFGAGVLSVAASVVTFFPQTVGLGGPLKNAAELAQKGAENIPNACQPEVCLDGGRIQPLDGGVRGICECQ